MVDIMNCHSDGHPKCRYLSKLNGRSFWTCVKHNTVTFNPEVSGCHYYETPGEHSLRVAFRKKFDEFDKKILEYDLWRHEFLVKSIRDGILYAVVAFTVLALSVWWTA
jgi:hypothetical protein